MHRQPKDKHQEYGCEQQDTPYPASEKEMTKAGDKESADARSSGHGGALRFENAGSPYTNGEILRRIRGRIRRVSLQHHWAGSLQSRKYCVYSFLPEGTRCLARF